jgi:hypothetical protein
LTQANFENLPVESEGSKATESKMGSLKGKMIYNELGILVEADKLDTPIDSNVMGITHMIKLIHVNWQHHVSSIRSL